MDRLKVVPVSLGPDQYGARELFSAFYPLGCVVAYAKAYRDGALRESFDFGRITPEPARNIPDILQATGNEGGIFLLSSYVWNHAVNMDFARQLKERQENSLVVAGGPSIPRQVDAARQFLASHPYVDVLVRHEGELTLSELLDTVSRSRADAEQLRRVDFSGVDGITFRRDDDVVRTADRARSRDLELYPSPYTTGEFDHWIEGSVYAPFETNRGCPYGCTFCDWGAATLSKISKMSMDRVLGEIDYAARMKVHTIGFCDANFGILPRDLEIVQHIVDVKDRFGYPQVVGYTNAKTAKPRLGEIVKTLRDAGLTAAAQISMQTIDEGVLQNVERQNIKTSEYRAMIAFFHREGIPAVSDMMIGLPGQTFETCKVDLQFFFDHRVLAVIFATSVMPNAPMADEAYRRKFGIELDADNMVAATFSFTREDYARMFELCLAYKLFVKLGLLKYLLYFVQLERGIRAMEFVSRWLARVDEAPELYPISSRIKRDLLGRDYRGIRKDWLMLAWSDAQGAFLFDSLEAFQDEVIRFFGHEHGMPLAGTDVDAVLLANREVMPKKGRPRSREVPLEHDVVGYFEELHRLPNLDAVPADRAPLSARSAGVLKVSTASDCTDYGHVDMGLTFGELEQASNLRI